MGDAHCKMSVYRRVSHLRDPHVSVQYFINTRPYVICTLQILATMTLKPNPKLLCCTTYHIVDFVTIVSG